MKQPKFADFANRFKLAREKANLNIYQIAVMLGITPTSVWQWEQGIALPRPHSIPRIAEILGVDPHWLATGEGDMEPKQRKFIPIYSSVKIVENEIILEKPTKYLSLELPVDSFAIIATDDALKPIILKNDYIIIAKTKADIQKKNIYFVGFENNFLLRIVEVDKEGNAILSALNPKYPIQIIPLNKLKVVFPIIEIRRCDIDTILTKIF